ncbi:MAG: hypothetical protein WCS42_23850 [Verrucomicrobiota bacterium]
MDLMIFRIRELNEKVEASATALPVVGNSRGIGDIQNLCAGTGRANSGSYF